MISIRREILRKLISSNTTSTEPPDSLLPYTSHVLNDSLKTSIAVLLRQVSGALCQPIKLHRAGEVNSFEPKHACRVKGSISGKTIHQLPEQHPKSLGVRCLNIVLDVKFDRSINNGEEVLVRVT